MFSVLLSVNISVGRSSHANTIFLPNEGMINYETDKPWWGLCVMDLAFGNGSFFCDDHIDMVADAGGDYLRVLVDPSPWRANVPVRSTNTEYAGMAFRDYMKALVDYAESRGVYIMYDISIYGSERVIAILNNEPNDRGMTRQDWIDLGREIIQYCDPHAVNICDEPARGEYVADWDAPTSGKITSVEWREFLVECIEDWRAIASDVTIGVMGVSMHFLNMFYKYDTVISPGGVDIRIKGDGPLPYDDIVYILNRPPYGSSDGYDYVRDYCDAKVGPLADYQEFKDQNQAILFTTGFAEDYNVGDYPSSWLTYATAFWDYNREKGYWCISYTIPASRKWSLLDSSKFAWNDMGQAWANYTTQYIES